MTPGASCGNGSRGVIVDPGMKAAAQKLRLTETISFPGIRADQGKSNGHKVLNVSGSTPRFANSTCAKNPTT